MSVQAEILNLLNRLKASYSMTYLLVSHDSHVVAHMCDRAAVMSHGKIERLIGRDHLSQINPDERHRNFP
jgi:peptide/nickel transport system ATP-binding protein